MYRLSIPAAVLAASATAPALGAEPDGEALHAQACTQCHGTEVYGGIDSRRALRAQVGRCARGPAGVDWSDAQMAAVTDYLTRFYPFD
jgi:cytochrome c2